MRDFGVFDFVEVELEVELEVEVDSSSAGSETGVSFTRLFDLVWVCLVEVELEVEVDSSSAGSETGVLLTRLLDLVWVLDLEEVGESSSGSADGVFGDLDLPGVESGAAEGTS